MKNNVLLWENLVRWILILCCFGISGVSVAQTNSIASPFSSLFDYHKATRPEKLYLTLDRPYYEAGDTLWFRGTLVNANNHSYIVKTNYIYVELLNRSDQVVLRRKVLRDNLCFHHNLPLSDSLASGEYTLRAYTSWMRNFSPDYYYSRKLSIFNKYVPAVARPLEERDFGLTFFPEGGTLLQGVSQQLAYKAEGSDGYPVDIDGVVKDSRGNVLTELHSFHDGMGSITLPADAFCGDTLWAEVELRGYRDSNGMPFGRTFALPQARSAGYALHVEPSGANEVSFKVLCSNNGMGTESGNGFGADSLLLLLHSGSNLIACRKLSCKGEMSGSVDISQCRVGVNHFVLCTREGIGLSRRLYFRHDTARVVYGDIRCESSLREARDLVTLRMRLADAGGRPVRGDFSVSVVDAEQVDCGSDSLRDNIVSNLLLSSDLRGYIHAPGWYFSNDVPLDERLQGLDLVMQTHGWSRFSTEDLRRIPPSDAFPHPLEEREWLSGQITALVRKDREKSIPITVVDTTSGTYGTGQLDSLGRFFIGDLNYPDRANLQIRVLTTGKKPRFEFDKVEFPEGGHKEPFGVAYAEYEAEVPSNELMVIGGERTKVLGNIEVRQRRRRKERKIDFTALSLQRDAAYLKANYDYYRNDRGIDLINELIENEWSMWVEPLDVADIRIDDDAPFMPSDDKREKYRKRSRRVSEMYINGRVYDFVSGVGLLLQLYSEDIAKVELINGGNGVSNGTRILDITLHPGAEISDVVRDHRRTTHQVFGYTLPEYFYNPLYRTAEEKKWPEPDLRKTLRWEPSLQTDREGRLDFQFYNSDRIGARYVVIEGVAFDGRPVRVEKRLR